MRLYTKDYSAIAELRLRKAITIPVDSTAAIKKSGMHEGDKYLSLNPGSETSMSAHGGLITDTLAFLSRNSYQPHGL